VTGEFHGPVYRTWDEAMADPDLDLSKPWYVADPDAPQTPPPAEPFEWPSGWVEIGATTDVGDER